MPNWCMNKLTVSGPAQELKRIEEMPLDYIRDWLDGKNQLEWEGVAKTT